MATVPDMMDAAPEADAPADEGLTLQRIANHVGDLSPLLQPSDLARIGGDVIRDYERDEGDREEWRKKAEAALDAAAQCTPEEAVTFPFNGASDTHYPILTVAALQFQARAYPAIFKGDEVVKVKVVGKDREGQKAKRAGRVKDYLNTVFCYRIKDWEADTDALLLQLPIVGCAFRKVWWDAKRGKPAAAFVPALNLVVPQSAKSLETAPRFTEVLPPVYPHQIRAGIKSGFYRDVVLPSESEDMEAPRQFLEQNRLMDLDGDGVDEPYIVTVDKATQAVMRIEPAFDEADIELDGRGQVAGIKRRVAYKMYSFFPDPKGGFYPIGFGHLLGKISAIIDTAINQMFDAGQAAIAGGGFIASGLRLQGNRSWLEWQPGEYKVVNATGVALRDSIWERTLPAPSPIMFQLLDLMLGAARDIAAIKDVTSGDASNQGQVGTTLALIEQGLQVFNAIWKRTYRGLRDEFQQVYYDIAAWGDGRTQADYVTVLDDPEAQFQADFNAEDMDIRPVSDPESVTRMQKMARANFVLSLTQFGANPVEALRRALEAADIEDQDKLLPPPPQGPDPAQVAEVEKTQSETAKNLAQAKKADAEAVKTATEIGMTLGEADAGATEGALQPGGLAGMAGQPDGTMAVPGDGGLLPDPEGGMGEPVMGPGEGGPAGPV